MKTPFSRTPRRRNAFLNPGAGTTVLAVGGLILALFIMRAAFPDTLATLASPLWRAGDAFTVATHGVAAVLGGEDTLIAERDRLLAENETLRARADGLAAERDDLARLLGARTAGTDGVLASVLARPPVSPYDTLLLDRGSEAGVASGARVLGPGGTPIGTIESTSRQTARALLYSASGQVSEGWVGAEREPITLTGAGAGAFRANVPRDAAIAVGDTVFLPGPGAVPVGHVVRVDADPSAPRAVVHVRPIMNPFSVTWVEVVRN